MPRTMVCLMLISSLLLVGCASSSESGGRSASLSNVEVGRYSPPPAGATRPRVGCPPWQVQEAGGKSGGQKLDDSAADIMTTLAVRSNRFQVVERAQLEQLLKEQGLEGIVRPGEMAQYGQVRGVDYLLFGKITNLRVKREDTSSGFGIGDVRLPLGGSVGGMDVKSDQTVIKVEMGVDLRLVDPETGAVVAANFSDFERVDEAGAVGVKILGAQAQSGANLEIDEDSKGRLMRYAIDDAYREMLPDIDRALATK